MPQIEILSEQEVPQGWVFEAQSLNDEGTLRRHRVSLSWADYNLWSSDGSDEPARVAEAVLSFVLTRVDNADAIGERFDASTVRRRFANADDVIPGLIGRA